MGKATKWFRGILGLKKSDPNPTPNQPHKTKRNFANTNREKDQQKAPNGVVSGGQYDESAARQAAEVVAATARIAVAQSAAAALRRPSTGRSASGGVGQGAASCVGRGGAVYGGREEWAAVTIQSHFRAYLSRRALRALKSLVKLQALVKGHLVRKQTAHTLRRLQALVRAQTRARAGRVLNSESLYSSMKSAHFNYSGPATPEKIEHATRARSIKHEQSMMLKRSGSKSNGSVNYDLENLHLRRMWMDARMAEKLWEQGSLPRIIPNDDERNYKILEMDTGKPHLNPKRKNLFHSCHLSMGSDHNGHSFSTSKDSAAYHTVLSSSCCEAQSLSPLDLAQDTDESVYCTAENSPHFYSGYRSKRGSFTPTKSDCSRSCLSGYSDHPNYMAYTESSKAKVRSVSAPKQRPQYERSSSTKRNLVHDLQAAPSVSVLHANFTNKVYPGSGRLDRLGMPIRADVTGFSGGHWNRF